MAHLHRMIYLVDFAKTNLNLTNQRLFAQMKESLIGKKWDMTNDDHVLTVQSILHAHPGMFKFCENTKQITPVINTEGKLKK